MFSIIIMKSQLFLIAVKKIKDAQITKQATLAVANQKARNAGNHIKSN